LTKERKFTTNRKTNARGLREEFFLGGGEWCYISRFKIQLKLPILEDMLWDVTRYPKEFYFPEG
jgi:hypothetical protein